MFIVNGPRDVGGGVDEAADQSHDAKVCAERKKKKKGNARKKERKKKETYERSMSGVCVRTYVVTERKVRGKFEESSWQFGFTSRAYSQRPYC